ncbi:hypothetical protein [Vibrio barjaei]|uniref:hypothetical protein n=1 Tax=Vibrio barjaei TaxID=1676683 RepID=UPI0022842F3C|nr:hypothetical protein [Vibrio barjaei]MCY9874045.1 hypothetical protein [Vibrio barjaei]
MSRRLVWLPKGEKVDGVSRPVCENVKLERGERVSRLWTLLYFNSESVKPPVSMAVAHGDNALLESEGHDWFQVPGALKYRSNNSDGGCWLLLELEQ